MNACTYIHNIVWPKTKTPEKEEEQNNRPNYIGT